MDKIIEFDKKARIALSELNGSLRQLLDKYPDYPIVLAVKAQDKMYLDSKFSLCSGLSIQIAEVLDTVILGTNTSFLNREDFLNFVVDKVSATLVGLDLPEFEYTDRIDEIIAEAEPFWKKCILLVVTP